MSAAARLQGVAVVKRRAFLVRGSNATAVLCAVATESVANEAAAGASSLATRPMANVLDPVPHWTAGIRNGEPFVDIVSGNIASAKIKYTPR